MHAAVWVGVDPSLSHCFGECRRLTYIKSLLHQRRGRERALIEERVARLTSLERDVLRQVIAGRLNKQIAADHHRGDGEAAPRAGHGQVGSALGGGARPPVPGRRISARRLVSAAVAPRQQTGSFRAIESRRIGAQ